MAVLYVDYHSGRAAVVDKLSFNRHRFLVSQGFATETLNAESLRLSCVPLDFSEVQVHNNQVRDVVLDKYERLT